jgi:hypothetical protein
MRFIANQELTREQYRVQSAIATDAFRAFIAAIEGNAVDITEVNCAELSQLCEEFGFDGLTAQLSMFQPSAALRDAEARRRISALAAVREADRRAAVETVSADRDSRAGDGCVGGGGRVAERSGQ